jgi:hypothetical protein
MATARGDATRLWRELSAAGYSRRTTIVPDGAAADSEAGTVGFTLLSTLEAALASDDKHFLILRDIDTLRCDFQNYLKDLSKSLRCGGHMLGQYGSGVLYLGPELQSAPEEVRACGVSALSRPCSHVDVLCFHTHCRRIELALLACALCSLKRKPSIALVVTLKGCGFAIVGISIVWEDRVYFLAACTLRSLMRALPRLTPPPHTHTHTHTSTHTRLHVRKVFSKAMRDIAEHSEPSGRWNSWAVTNPADKKCFNMFNASQLGNCISGVYHRHAAQELVDYLRVNPSAESRPCELAVYLADLGYGALPVALAVALAVACLNLPRTHTTTTTATTHSSIHPPTHTQLTDAVASSVSTTTMTLVFIGTSHAEPLQGLSCDLGREHVM